MSKRKQSFAARSGVITLLALLLILITSAGCGGRVSNDAAASSAARPAVVATVNGREIRTPIYEMYLKNGREELGLNETTEEGRQQILRLREAIVSELIDRELVRQEAARRNLSAAPERLAEEEKRAVERLGGEEKFKTYLAEHGLTREQFMETVYGPVYGELVRRELGRDLKVSDEEVKAYYEAHRGEEVFRVPERVTASHILVAARPSLIARELQREKNLAGDALQSAVRAEMARRRERAEGLRRRALAKGADFAALAREASDDPGTRERGGALGQFPRNSHPKPFDDAAFVLKTGEISPVVETDYGFHIIKVTAREAARTTTLEEAAPDIRRRLIAEREAATLRDWVKEARRKAQVRVAEPFRLGALKDEFSAL